MEPPLEFFERFAKVEISDTAIIGTAIKLNSLVNTVAIKSITAFMSVLPAKPIKAPTISAPMYKVAVIALPFPLTFDRAVAAAA